jgi:hypothetical protein
MADLFQSRLDHDLKTITNALATYLTWSLQNSVTKHHDTEPHGTSTPVSTSQESLTLEQSAVVELNPDQAQSQHYEIEQTIPQQAKVQGDIVPQAMLDPRVTIDAVIVENDAECDRSI